MCKCVKYEMRNINEYDRHLDTNKHKRLHGIQEENSVVVEPMTFKCNCGNIYIGTTQVSQSIRAVAKEFISQIIIKNKKPVVQYHSMKM